MLYFFGEQRWVFLERQSQNMWMGNRKWTLDTEMKIGHVLGLFWFFFKLVIIYLSLTIS